MHDDARQQPQSTTVTSSMGLLQWAIHMRLSPADIPRLLKFCACVVCLLCTLAIRHILECSEGPWGGAGKARIQCELGVLSAKHAYSWLTSRHVAEQAFGCRDASGVIIELKG